MLLGIEASNILAGGGIVHLREVLTHANPSVHGFEKVVIWAPQATLNQLPEKEWLKKETHPWLNKNIVFRMAWLWFILPFNQKYKVKVLFSPGANLVFSSRVVTMCQNLLPFAPMERRLYGWSWMRLRIKLLNFIQRIAFYRARGIIFLTPCSVKYVYDQKTMVESKISVIPHGVLPEFYRKPSINNFNNPIRILYVSILDVYKHQWVVLEAVFNLLKKGCKVELELLGNSYGPAEKKLQKALLKHPEYADQVTWNKALPYERLKDVYHKADIFVFASSCETFSLILLEAMASGLPIACADRDTLKDTLGDAGVYFDPYDSKSIEKAFLSLIENKDMREEKKRKAYEQSRSYSWVKCADATFQYLSKIANS